MRWRGTQAACRDRYVAKYDTGEAERYDGSVGTLDDKAEAAHLSDLAEVFSFPEGAKVLDAGAGTGTLCKLLTRVGGLTITALEPAPAMLARLRSNAELKGMRTVEGFCDSIDDREHFEASEFDVIVSRQLGNCLFDPLVAFANWHRWLVPGGSVILLDGLYGRSAWAGVWEEEVDELPMSACQTMALAPYLLEAAGFQIEGVELMRAVNTLPSTMTTRFVAVARKAPD